VKPYYEHGGITIYHGDCREVLPTLETVDMVLTDPPYNAGIDYGPRTNDRRPWPAYRADMVRVIQECERVACGPVMIFVSVNGMIWITKRKPPVWVCCWVRPSGGTGAGNTGFYPSWEPCLVYGSTWGKGGQVPPWAMSDVWRDHPAKANGHPCPKPESLMRRILEKFESERNVLDPFMGSGTTLRAAKDLGRKAIGIEIEERYCEIAAKRLSQEVFDFEGAK
jgi:site-specific DNA-methyltransferase (adenine-specific)